VQNFAKHAGRLESGQPGQIHRRLGMTGSTQNTAIFRSEREDMPGLIQIFRRGFWVCDREDGGGSIVGADAGGDATRGID
jgi:hypothetical protein